MTELIIGARRVKPRRRLRTAVVAVLVAALAATAAGTIFARATAYPEPAVTLPADPAAATADGELTYSGGRLSRRGRVWVLRVAGGARSMGAARGHLLAPLVAPVGAALDAALARTVPDGGWLDRRLHAARMRWQFRLLDDAIAGHQLVEIAAAAAAAGGDYAQWVRREAAIDVGVPRGGRVSATVARALTVVAPVRGPEGERLIVGRVFSLPGSGDGGDSAAAAPVVTFAHPDGALAFASVEWPGAIGAVTGVNREGIAVLVQPARTADVRAARAGKPSGLIARDVLETARTLDDAIAIVEHATPLGAAAFVLVDGARRQWAIVERSPEGTATRRPDAATAVGGVLSADPFEDDPINEHARRASADPQRIRRANELLRMHAPESAADMVALLRDRRAAGGAPLPPGHRGAIDDYTAVHAAVIDPSSMALWVSDPGGPHARFRAFDLLHELRGEGAVPAPPADIPAPEDFDDAVPARVRAARAALRRASAAAGPAAEEWLQRALALAPDVPEIQLAAAQRARRRGDAAAAAEHARRFLELGADDPEAEAQLRASGGSW